MKIQEIRFILPNLPPSENVITIAGRSGREYQFIWHNEEKAHVRVYRDLADPEQLNADELDLATAPLPDGWALLRRFVFGEGAAVVTTKPNDAEARALARVLRIAILKLWNRIDADSAKATFTEDDWNDAHAYLKPLVDKIFTRFGVRMPTWEVANKSTLGISEGYEPETETKQDSLAQIPAAKLPAGVKRRPGRPTKSQSAA